MKMKNKLKGEVIFIENDLIWQERRVQGKISKWAREKRSEGMDVKIGYGKLRINGEWKYWSEMEKIIGKDLEEKESKEIGDELEVLSDSKDEQKDENFV